MNYGEIDGIGGLMAALSALSLTESRATSNKPKAKEAREITEMLTGLAMNLEQLLAYRADPATVQYQWGRVEEHLDRQGRTRRRNRIIALIVVMVLIIGGIVALAILA